MTRPHAPDPAALPRHDDFTVLRRAVEAACIAVALGLLAWHAARLAATPGLLRWWLPLAIVAGALAADLVSGLIHWTADTWGSEVMPLLGRRFVRPFRVHHVNPDDFLRRGFLDTNGDVAAIVAGFLALGLLLPLDVEAGRAAAVALLAFCVAGLPTNQVHQWAHMPRPPRLVRRLQNAGLILSFRDHLRHHRAPYAAYYCIATGWLNRPLEKIDFFRRLERLVSRLTGLQPREDDSDFQAKTHQGRDRQGSVRADLVSPQPASPQPASLTAARHGSVSRALALASPSMGESNEAPQLTEPWRAPRIEPITFPEAVR